MRINDKRSLEMSKTGQGSSGCGQGNVRWGKRHGRMGGRAGCTLEGRRKARQDNAR